MLRSPHDVRPHLDTITSTALQYLSYDPNYADDMDADEDEDQDEDEDEDECASAVPKHLWSTSLYPIKHHMLKIYARGVNMSVDDVQAERSGLQR